MSHVYDVPYLLTKVACFTFDCFYATHTPDRLNKLRLTTHNDIVHPTFRDDARTMGMIRKYDVCSTMLAGGCQLEHRQVVTLYMSELDAIAAALREIVLSVQHHNRINESAGLPPVIHLHTEYFRFNKHNKFDPNKMRVFVDEHIPNLITLLLLEDARTRTEDTRT